ncbi:MAG: CPBP family intramembrane metalloprotease [Myxococcaceae bacterium]|nr:CPBP family intramembrane metalloprotease [Myxococcaceae bacterium]
MARLRPWLSLVIAPLCLAACFALAAVALLATGKATPEAVGATLQASPVAPATAGFLLAFVLARWFARADGLTLAALGWSRPGPKEALVALAAVLVFAPLNTFVLFPLVQRADPSFDATAGTVSLVGAVLMFSAAVVAEETVYRGYALTLLKARLGVAGAVVATSLAYALLAPGATWPPKAWALGFGLLASALRLWRGTLWVPAVVHLGASLTPKLLALAG